VARERNRFVPADFARFEVGGLPVDVAGARLRVYTWGAARPRVR
jgi:hypothetical protein